MRVVLLAVALAGVGAGAFDRGTATIGTRSGPVVVQVEIADTRAERQKGLMGRRTLAPRAGMLFVYPTDARGGFWMKSTLIPLDIAFADRRGRILRILRMTPCRADPCRLYVPGVTYRLALEVNAGALRRWNVRVGDRIAYRVTRP